MKKKRLMPLCIGSVLAILGIVLTVITRSAAIINDAPISAKMPFALALIALLVGLVTVIAALIPERKPVNARTLAIASLFAALCYIGFTYFRIDIPVGSEKTAFHLGNVFCVLAALFLGGMWGGMAGAVGMTLADLTTAYVTSAPKTFLLKLCIGLITGLVAHKGFHISQEKSRKIKMPIAVVLSSAAGMAFNIVADPLVGYFYKTYVMGVPQEFAKVWAKMGAVTTSVNAVVAVICASVFYLALRPALKKTNLLPHV